MIGASVAGFCLGASGNPKPEPSNVIEVPAGVTVRCVQKNGSTDEMVCGTDHALDRYRNW